MPSIRLEDLTPFGRAAVKLDQELSELVKIGGQMEGVQIDSDGGVDEGIKLLNRAAPYSESVAGTMQEFAKTLQEARDRAEAAMKVVAERGQLIQRRRAFEDELQAKLTALSEQVKDAGAGLAGLGKAGPGGLSDEQKRQVAAELEKLREPMNGFIAAGQALKDEAAAGKFRRLERQAESMIDSLRASLRKIAEAVAAK